MQVYYDGAHSVMFENPSYDPEAQSGTNSFPYFSSWEKWHLIPTSRPVIEPPPLKTNTIEVPGANAVIDLTDVPRGFPTYGNRTGSLDFYVDNSDPSYDWAAAYNNMKSFFHGFKLKMYLTDDASSYYYGRWTVNSWKSNKTISTISLNYDLDPFMYSMFSTTEPWLWNPFDFLNGIIPVGQEDFIGLSAPSEKYYMHEVVGAMPVSPTFTVTSGGPVKVQVWNSYNSKWTEEVTVSSGTPVNNPSVFLSTPRPGDYSLVKLTCEGQTVGTVDIDFRPGRL